MPNLADRIRAAFRPRGGSVARAPLALPASAEMPPAHDAAPLAPYPHIDRYPTVLGSQLNLSYISSVFRLATSGYRREYVDVLDELLERDPHAFAVLAQRILAVAGGRIEVSPPRATRGTPDEARAAEIAERVEAEINAIPDLQQSLASLLWAVYYGVAASEVNWRRDADGWHVARLHWIHSRRIAYPSPTSWRAHIWDQGLVTDWQRVGQDPTSQVFGLSVDDFPGKFVVHAPQLRGDYPTRDGLGREIAYWMAIKGMAARGVAQYVERYAKPWAFAYYTTDDKGVPRAADDDDIKAADQALRALGAGSLSGAALPDCVKIELAGPGAQTAGRSQLAGAELVKLCNGEIAKAVLGQSDTTDAGANGSRSSTEVRKEGTRELLRYDAGALSDTLETQLVRWIVALNFPGDERLCPTLRIHVDERPDPAQLAATAAIAVGMGMPLDADSLGEALGLDLVAKDGAEPRLLAPLHQMSPGELADLLTIARGGTPAPKPAALPPAPPTTPTEAPDDGAHKDA